MAEPKINVDSRWWDLDATPANLDTAARKWRALGTVGDDTAEDIHTGASKVLDDSGRQWQGDTRDTFETRKTQLVKAMSGTKSTADSVADALEGIATALRNRQGDLSEAKSSITGKVANTDNGSQITFAPKDASESKAVMNAITGAKNIRSQLDSQLSTYLSSLESHASDWNSISDTWSKWVADGADDPFDLPPESERDGPAKLTLPDGSVVINTGNGDEDTKVSTDGDGNVIVTIDGEQYRYPPGTPIMVRGGAGDDTVQIDPSADNDISVLGGKGDDTIVDNGLPGEEPSEGERNLVSGDGSDTVVVSGSDKNIATGAGQDEVKAIGDNNNVTSGGGKDNVVTTGGYVSGGRGDDTIQGGDHDDPLYGDEPEHSVEVYGGEGDDTIDGSSKDDTIVGGSGNDTIAAHGGDDVINGDGGFDYIDGQDGDDVIDGGADKDQIYGLDGNDRIYGGSGRDNLEGAHGNDFIEGGSGEDLVSGGHGDDDLRGGDDDDKIYAGEGTDTIDGGEGNDETFAQDEDNYSSDTETYTETEIVDTDFIEVRGSEEYQDRVRADLDMIGASPNGGDFIDSLRAKVDESHNDWKPGENEIVINETDDDRSNASQGNWPGADVEINFNHDKYTSGADGYESQSILYHELAHGWDYLHGTGNRDDYINPADPDTEDGDPVSNIERQAVGLDYDFDGDGTIDDARHPDNPHPYRYSQNAFNEETGRDPLTHYAENKPPS